MKLRNKTVSNFIKGFAIGILASAFVAGVGIFLWFHGAFLPGWISWEEKTVVIAEDASTTSAADGAANVAVDGVANVAVNNSSNAATNATANVAENNAANVTTNTAGSAATEDEPLAVTLHHRQLSITQNGKSLWTLDSDVLVQDFLWCDINRDGQQELMVLCWKIGRYGKHRPFWVEKDERTWSQHIFVYHWNEAEQRMQAIWMASDLGLQAKNWKYDEHGILLIEDTEGELSGWRWPDWGLERTSLDVNLVAVGDNLIHAPIYRYGLQQNDNFDFLYENVKEEIESADIAVINQETIYIDDPARYSDYPNFGTPLAVGDAVANAGFDVVSCATNHAFDQGMDGINVTAGFYDEAGICYIGIEPQEEDSQNEVSQPEQEEIQEEDSEKAADRLNQEKSSSEQDSEGFTYHPYEIVKRNGMRIAFLNYTYGLNGKVLPENNPYAVHTLREEEQVVQDLQQARKDADIVIVCVHWGTEYNTKIDDRPNEQLAGESAGMQEKWTQIFYDNNVDIVIGTHPHVLQPYRMITGSHSMRVYYSLGNFVSAQDEVDRILGGMANVTLSYTMDGIQITDYGMKPLVTHQADGFYTTYLLEDYSEELAQKHRLTFTTEELWEKYHEYTEN